MRINRENLAYRDCVGIMLINDKNEVFVGKRIDSRHNAWQMPQGGVEKNEAFLDAAKRELLEEIGTNNVEILCETKEIYKYDIPDDLIPNFWGGIYRGQAQKWFLAKFLGSDAEINIKTAEPEFCEWRWIDRHRLVDVVVPFKKDLYKKILEEFKHL